MKIWSGQYFSGAEYMLWRKWRYKDIVKNKRGKTTGFRGIWEWLSSRSYKETHQKWMGELHQAAILKLRWTKINWSLTKWQQRSELIWNLASFTLRIQSSGVSTNAKKRTQHKIKQMVMRGRALSDLVFVPCEKIGRVLDGVSVQRTKKNWYK